MSCYVPDTRALLLERGHKRLSSRVSSDAGFPRGPASRCVVITHMGQAGYPDDLVEEAGRILSAAGVP